MKLSFSLPSKTSSRPNHHKPSENFNEGDGKKDDGQIKHEYVTEFDASKTLNHSEKLVIPPKPNEWRPLKKMRNLDLPVRFSTGDTDIGFELEAPSTAGIPDSGMSYGLNLRQAEEVNGGGDANDKQGGDLSYRSGPLEDVMLQKFKEDMENLPDDQGLDEFVDVPVEDFAAAYLSGYGWFEGRGIGRNAKEDVKVVQHTRRAGKEGLGFVAEMQDVKNMRKNPGAQHVTQKGPDGPNRQVENGVDEKLAPSREPREGVSIGKVVRIVGGRHVGLKGKVVEKLTGGDSDSPKVVLKLSRGGVEEVTVALERVAELGSVEDERCLKKLQELKVKGLKDDQSRDNRGERDGDKDHRRKDDKRRKIEGRKGCDVRCDNVATYQSSSHREKANTPVSWLMSHIRVRVISKDLKGGKLYLKKGEVVDVVGPTTCDISMDESRELIQGVDQEMLETALPRRGGPVLVLYGRHKGVLGNLMEKDIEKETGVVQDADTHALLNVRLEQIAEYIGDPSYIGY